MLPFLPILGWALGGFLGGLFAGAVIEWIVDYLTKQNAKEHIQKQKKQKFEKDLSEYIGGLLESQEYSNHDIGLNTMLESPKQINYDTKKIPLYIKEQGKDLIILNLMGKYGYTNRKALLETSLERLQEMLWFNERNKQSRDMLYGHEETERDIDEMPNEIDWVLEDEESRRIFAGKYYNGEVISMEEIQAKEIDPELQWELDNEEIVIL